MRDLLFAVCLAVAGTLVAVGADVLVEGLGLIVGGLWLAALSWLMLGEFDDDGQGDR